MFTVHMAAFSEAKILCGNRLRNFWAAMSSYYVEIYQGMPDNYILMK